MKKIVVIGGGVAGLSAGIYAALNGFDAEIIEMHTVAGGQCTAWDRKGYRFDYCLHWLVGTSSGTFHDIWQETNVLNESTTVIDHPIHSKHRDENGDDFLIYSNIDQWEQYLVELAPEDEKSIRRMCNDMRKSAFLEPFATPSELRSVGEYLHSLPKMLPLINVVRKYGRITCREYFDKLKFTNARIKKALYSMYGESDLSALAFIFMLGWYHQKNAGYILGGSYPLAQRMVEKFEQRGGKITYKQRVEKILVEQNCAKGVQLANGQRIPADYVISASDAYATLYQLLEGRYLSRDIIHAFENWKLFQPLVQVSFGIGIPIPADVPVLSIRNKQLSIGMTPLESGYSIMNYAFDTTMAPKGKTTLVMRFESPWKLWEALEGEAYRKEKAAIETDAIKLLETTYPGITEYIEVIDVATPKTDVRYTGVKEGAYEGFLPSSKNLMKSLKQTLPGLDGFYLIGQWLSPGGGLPPSAQSGKFAVQRICHKEKRPFLVR